MRRGVASLLAAAGSVLAVAVPAYAGPPGHWETRPSAPAPRQEAAFAHLDGRLHLLGGLEAVPVDSVRHDVYDLASATWTPGVPLPEPAHHLQAAALGGKIYAVGGLQTLAFVPTGRVWVLDAGGGTWSPGPSLPAGRVRGAGAVTVHDGRLYYVGGLSSGDTAVGLADVFDPATGAWAPLPDMPTPRDHLGLAVVDGVLYAVGGRQAAFDTEVRATEALDLATRVWRRDRAPIPTPRGGFATGVVGGEVVTIGGEGPVGVYDDVEAYHPASDTWRALAPMRAARTGMQGAAIDGGIWIAGGAGEEVSSALEVFFPGPRPLPPAPAPATPQPGGSAATPRITLKILRARWARATRRVTLRLEASSRVRATVELLAPMGRRLARRTIIATPRGVQAALRPRRRLRPGRYRLVARAGPARAARRLIVR